MGECFLLVPAYLGSSGPKAVKRLLLFVINIIIMQHLTRHVSVIKMT